MAKDQKIAEIDYYWKWHENSWNLWRKSTGIYRKMQDHRDLMNDFDCAGKTKQDACKTLRVWTKNEENFENFQENSEIFWSKSLWKIDFFHNFLLNIFGFLTPLRKYRPLEDKTRFLQQFFRFRGGGTFRRPPRCYCPLAKNKSPKCNGPFHLKVFYKLWQHGFRLVPHDFFYWS